MSDRELVLRWVRAWAHVRRLGTEMVDGWPLVHVNGPSRQIEIVCVDPGRDAFEALAARLASDPRAMLTVLADDLGPYLAPPLPPRMRVDRDDEVFMTCSLAPTVGALPDGLMGRWIADGPRATYCVDGDGRVAAEGTVGVLGTDAVFDVVETSPAFRRRGLGRHVMGTLTTWAVDRGATTGLLAASADGAELYSALGWDRCLAMWSLMGTVSRPNASP